MKVGITYNLKTEVELLDQSQPLAEDMYEEFDSPETINAIRDVIVGLGHECVMLGYGKPAVEKIMKIEGDLDIVFNIAEGYFGRSRESHIPALLEMLEIPYTGSGALAAGLTLDKTLAKKIISISGVHTPPFYTIWPDEHFNYNVVDYPSIVKLAYEGSSKGIRQDSKVTNKSELKKKVKWLQKNYMDQPILVEKFMPGREFTVGVIGNDKPKILGIMEIIPKNTKLEDFIYSLEVKRNYLQEVEYTCPPKISDLLRGRLERAALRVYKAFNCCDVSRIDFRTDGRNIPYFLEINVLPGLHPVSSDLVIMARLLGISYNDLVKSIFNTAVERYGLKK
ncbi:D-alanine--D-alanine ligase [Candidatus Margulisiibacteriota bacterium]